MFRRALLRQLPQAIRAPDLVPSRTLFLPASRKPDPPACLRGRRTQPTVVDAQQREYRRFLVSGIVVGVFSFIYTLYKLRRRIKQHEQEAAQALKADTNLPPTDPISSPDAANRKVVVHDAEDRAIVLTGHSTVLSFPRTIKLPASPVEDPSSTPTTDYTLVGLGLRTVTFLGIGVYIVGFYVATPDIAAFRSALVQRVNPIATTLAALERDELRRALVNPSESEQLWDDLLDARIPARSVFRIIPVRDTDFHHLRDGFVRALQTRTRHYANDDDFGKSIKELKSFFNRGKAKKRSELLLVRDREERLAILFTATERKKDAVFKGERSVLGVVDDKKVSRALWKNYLAGSQVASEPARASVVEGIMEIVEQPVGTVAAKSV